MSILKIHAANYVMLKKTIVEMKSVEITKNEGRDSNPSFR